MKKNIDPKIITTVLVLLVLVIGFLAYRQFANNPASSTAVSPQQAGLGKPVLPSIPKQQAPAANNAGK